MVLPAGRLYRDRFHIEQADMTQVMSIIGDLYFDALLCSKDYENEEANTAFVKQSYKNLKKIINLLPDVLKRTDELREAEGVPHESIWELSDEEEEEDEIENENENEIENEIENELEEDDQEYLKEFAKVVI